MSRRPLVPGLATVLRLSARAERASVVAIALIAAVSSFVLAASARATDEAARRSVVEAVERAADGPGRLTFTADRAFASGGAADPLGPVSDALAAIAEEVPPAVDRLYEPPRAVLDTQRFLVVGVDGAPSPLPTRLTMRVHPDLDEHLAGPTEALADAGEVTEVVVPAPPDEPDVGPARLPSLDIGLTATTADELGVGLGSIWTVDADDTDALSGRIPGFRFPPFALRVARILEPTPPTERYWYGDARLHRPVRVDTGVGADLYVYAAVEPEDLVDAPFVDDSEILLTAIQRYDVDLDVLGGLGLDELDEARSGLDAMAARFPEASTTRLPGLETRLAAVLEDEADQIRIADAMRLLGSVGLVGVLGGLAATVLLLGMMRRAAWTAVARSRGGGWSITAAEVVETTLAVLVGTAVGLVAARLAVTDVATTGDRLGAALVAVVLITCRVAVSVAAELGGRVAVGVGRLRHAGPV
ncbi:MAG: hypothetical protein S0880_20485, partial [Actinomycetota bacterium]|nr:hypothetical protein [Actinomycetota bacterium]